MSYTNGVGNGLSDLQSLFGAGDVAATSKAAETAKSSALAGTATGAASANDQASLSTAGGLLAQALDGSDVRTEKVAALQQAISSGTYSVSAADVADKLISSLLK